MSGKHISFTKSGRSTAGARPRGNDNYAHYNEQQVPQIRYNADGTVDKTSAAVRQGLLRFTESGEIDKRSELIRDGTVSVKLNGQLDQRTTPMAAHNVDKSQLGAADLSDDGKAQRQKRQETTSEYADQKDADHILSKRVAQEALKHVRGKLSEQRLQQYAQMLNSQENLRMVLKETNRGSNNTQDALIEHALRTGDTSKFTAQTIQRLRQQVKSAERIGADAIHDVLKGLLTGAEQVEQ